MRSDVLLLLITGFLAQSRALKMWVLTSTSGKRCSTFPVD